MVNGRPSTRGAGNRGRDERGSAPRAPFRLPGAARAEQRLVGPAIGQFSQPLVARQRRSPTIVRNAPRRSGRGERVRLRESGSQAARTVVARPLCIPTWLPKATASIRSGRRVEIQKTRLREIEAKTSMQAGEVRGSVAPDHQTIVWGQRRSGGKDEPSRIAAVAQAPAREIERCGSALANLHPIACDGGPVRPVESEAMISFKRATGSGRSSATKAPASLPAGCWPASWRDRSALRPGRQPPTNGPIRPLPSAIRRHRSNRAARSNVRRHPSTDCFTGVG